MEDHCRTLIHPPSPWSALVPWEARSAPDCSQSRFGAHATVSPPPSSAPDCSQNRFWAQATDSPPLSSAQDCSQSCFWAHATVSPPPPRSALVRPGEPRSAPDYSQSCFGAHATDLFTPDSRKMLRAVSNYPKAIHGHSASVKIYFNICSVGEKYLY